MKAFLFIPVLYLCSCVHATSEKVTAFGGKGAYKSKSFSLVFNNEKSFRDGALAATTIAAAVASAYTSAAAETTAQVANSNAASVSKNAANNAAKTTINASNNATKTELAKIAVEAPK